MQTSRVIKNLFSKSYWTGFKGRYVLSIGILALIVAILMIAFMPNFIYKTSLKLFKAQSTTLNGVLLESIGISLEFGDYESIQATFDKIGASRPSVIFLEVLDPQGASLAKYEKQALGVITPGDFDENGYLDGAGFIANIQHLKIGEDEYALLLGLDNSTLVNLRSTILDFIMGLVALAVLGIIIGMVILVEILNRPLDILIDRMQDVATGEADLTRMIEVKSNDEFGQLSSWFNKFLERIRDLMLEIRSGTNTVNDIGQDMNTASSQVASSTESQEAQVTEIATSLQEMAVTIRESANNANDATESAQQATQAAQEGGSIIQQTIQGMGNISTSVHESSERIKELGEHSRRIGDIISVINDIADQTNLLALNASIEAARAGEHGRGFAVVADEVRVLAERTIKATSQIAGMVKNIQDGTQNAVEAMDTGIQNVDAGVNLSEQAGNAIQKIMDLNKDVQSAINLIAKAAEEQSNGAELISSSIETIKGNTNETAGTAQNMAQGSNRLSEAVEKLSEQVSQFKL